MNEAQIGLLIITPAIIGVAIALRVQGALSTGAAVAAAVVATAVASMLFLTQ